MLNVEVVSGIDQVIHTLVVLVATRQDLGALEELPLIRSRDFLDIGGAQRLLERLKSNALCDIVKVVSNETKNTHRDVQIEFAVGLVILNRLSDKHRDHGIAKSCGNTLALAFALFGAEFVLLLELIRSEEFGLETFDLLFFLDVNAFFA